MYPEFFIAPMRDELTRLGVVELRTPDEVDSTLTKDGTVMVIVNSVCGCAAGRARPGVALALQHDVKPDVISTVFAGADIEATEKARSYFTGRIWRKARSYFTGIRHLHRPSPFYGTASSST